MTLFQCIVCVIQVSCVCNTKLFMYWKQHAQCNIAARWRGGRMQIYKFIYQIYIFEPTYFELKYRTNLFTQMERNVLISKVY